MYKKIINAQVLFCQGDSYFLQKKDILIKDNVVCHVGNCTKEALCLDLQGYILLPMFFNIHCHLGESIYKEIGGQDWTLQKYLAYTENYNCRLDKLQREQEWLKSAEYTINLLKQNGISVFCSARSAQISQQYKMKNMSGYPIMNSVKLLHYKNQGLNGFKEYYRKYSSDSCSVGVFLHSVYANDSVSLKLAFDCMSNGAEFLTVHVAEDMLSAQMEWQKYGKSAVKILDEYGLLTDKTVLVHCGYATDSDLKLIAQRNSAIAICPVSNRFLNTRMPDIYRLEEYGISWCITTDGLATGRSFSLPLQIGAVKEKYPLLSGQKLLSSITNLPAKYFKRACYTGNIETGTEAKFLAVKYGGKDISDMLEYLFGGEKNFECIEWG